MNQLDLLAPGKHKDMYERASAIIHNVEIENTIMQVFRAQPDREFESYHLFDIEVVRRFDATDCVGHILGRLARAGVLTAENRYFGSDHPDKPNYLGFTTVYKLRTS